MTTIAPRGEIDMAVSGALGADLARLHADGVTAVLDLRAVTFLDSTGVCALVRAALDARGDGWDLTMVAPSGAALRVLQLCGVVDDLPFVSAGVAG